MIEELVKKLCDSSTTKIIIHSVNTYNAVRSINRQIEEEKITHEKKVHQLKTQLAAVQRECHHPMVHYHGDPAGGSDSWSECEVCGASV